MLPQANKLQTCQQISRTEERGPGQIPQTVFKGNQLYWHLDLGFLASIIRRTIHFSCLSQPVAAFVVAAQANQHPTIFKVVFIFSSLPLYVRVIILPHVSVETTYSTAFPLSCLPLTNQDCQSAPDGKRAAWHPSGTRLSFLLCIAPTFQTHASGGDFPFSDLQVRLSSQFSTVRKVSCVGVSWTDPRSPMTLMVCILLEENDLRKSLVLVILVHKGPHIFQHVVSAVIILSPKVF